MNLFPKASGSRPRIACEIAAEGVSAARSATADGPIDSVARIPLAPGAVQPSHKPGNLADRVATIAAIRRALESIEIRPNSRGADLTLVIPDPAVRVLLLDFDALPTRLTESLPIVRFRLKKLLPFEADDAMISFQIMSSTRNNVRVLAVATPRDILREYETAVREAGYEPGAVLPSTLAALASVATVEPALVVNAGQTAVTTAITRAGEILLHRSVDLRPPATGADVMREAVVPNNFRTEPAPVSRSPYLDPTLQANLNAELHNAVLVAPTSVGTLTDSREFERAPEFVRTSVHLDPLEQAAESVADEITQAVTAAVAYFEDTLSAPPSTILSAGALGADGLRYLLHSNGYTEADALRVRELLDSSAFAGDAVLGKTPRGALAGVAGALRG